MTSPKAPTPAPVPWHEVWTAVAGELRRYRAAGLELLLTEDVVRFSSIRALVDAGVSPDRLRVEWAPPVLRGGKVDLVVDDPVAAAVEFKYPREPRTTNPPWTQHLGQMLADVYRLAVLPGVGTRLAAIIATDRLSRFLSGTADRYGVDLLAARVELTAERVLGAARDGAPAAGSLARR